jgi:hypothetical protein
MTEARLLRRIERLRKRLDNAVARGFQLSDPEVVEVSHLMDQLIANYLRMTKDRELPSLGKRGDETV